MRFVVVGIDVQVLSDGQGAELHHATHFPGTVAVPKHASPSPQVTVANTLGLHASPTFPEPSAIQSNRTPSLVQHV